jgi:hypothetical protein
MLRALAILLVVAAACSRGRSVTFTEDVEPILQTRCDGCHALGGIAPVPLDSYLKAKIHGSAIDQMVASGAMPPWPPSDRGVPLKGARALDAEEVRILRQWVAGGMPKGPDSAHRDRQPDLRTVRADQEVAMAEPYLPADADTDDYRCFIIDPGAASNQMITGYSVRPGTPGNVHHVILFEVLDQGTALRDLQALDDADPGPGYSCFGGPMVDTSGGGPLGLPPIRFVGGWAPGQGATLMPAHTGIPLMANSRLLMQVHYNLLNGRNLDLTTAVLQLDPRRPDLVEALLVPIPDGDFYIPAGASSYTHQKTYLLPSWVPRFTVYSVYPHMHLLGRQIQISTIQRGGEKLLLDIPRWDFHWQGAYELQDPVQVSAGDSIRVRCTWDNSPEHQPELRGVRRAPRAVSWGERTTDEMCLGFLYVTF